PRVRMPSRATPQSQAHASAAGGSVCDGRWRVPEISAEQVAAYVFTSGSTGVPIPYPKTWGKLVRCVRDEAARLGFVDGRSHALLATVPPQHMYGFESSVLLALQ